MLKNGHHKHEVLEKEIIWTSYSIHIHWHYLGSQCLSEVGHSEQKLAKNAQNEQLVRAVSLPMNKNEGMVSNSL
jgi:hypothetical protein